MRKLTALLVLAALCPLAPAQDGLEQPAEVTVGVEFPTQYFFRGFLEEDQGFIFQPYADGSFKLLEGDGPVNEVRLIAGWFNSFHTGPTGSDGDNASPEMWYETEIRGGLEATIAQIFDAGAEYIVRVSPNDVFETHHELDLTLAIDDRQLLGTEVPVFGGINPHVRLAIELSGVRKPEENHGEGVYLELGIEPALNLFESAGGPVVLSLPVTLGTSLGDYYEDETGSDDFLGYLDLGLELTLPMSVLLDPLTVDQGRLSGVELYGGIHWLHLGDNLGHINHGDTEERTAKGGARIRF
jgi:hypothetical protein